MFPAHDYKSRSHSTLADEIATNPRLRAQGRDSFIAMMGSLNLSMPTHIAEALRTNLGGGNTVAQMLAEAAATVPFMSMAELKSHVASPAAISAASRRWPRPPCG